MEGSNFAIFATSSNGAVSTRALSIVVDQELSTLYMYSKCKYVNIG